MIQTQAQLTQLMIVRFSAIALAYVIAMLSLPVLANIPKKNSPPQNVIMVISDGMGPAYTSAYRYYMDNQQTDPVELTVFDSILVGSSSTYAAGTQQQRKHTTYVTDSAASATALSTGVKTYNQAIAINTDNEPQESLMHYAKKIGKKTGLVVTSQINHATPAAFITHNTYRYNYEAIADDFFDQRINGQFIADLMFGGGQHYFIRQDRNLVSEFISAGYQYIDNLQQIDQFNSLPALGLFAEVSLAYAIDDPANRHRLTRMVTTALQLLTTPGSGFFLLVEASLVDWCGHDNDIACAMHEIDDLANTVTLIKSFIDKHPNTLLVMTADHNTGGLSVGANNQYKWRKNQIKKIRHSIHLFSKQLLKKPKTPVLTLWKEHMNIEISEEQIAHLSAIRQQAMVKINQRDHNSLTSTESTSRFNQQQEQLTRQIATMVADLTLTGWTSFNHTGDDVNVYAYGQGKSQFYGFHDNVDIAKKLFKLLGRDK